MKEKNFPEWLYIRWFPCRTPQQFLVWVRSHECRYCSFHTHHVQQLVLSLGGDGIYQVYQEAGGAGSAWRGGGGHQLAMGSAKWKFPLSCMLLFYFVLS